MPSTSHLGLGWAAIWRRMDLRRKLLVSKWRARNTAHQVRRMSTALMRTILALKAARGISAVRQRLRRRSCLHLRGALLLPLLRLECPDHPLNLFT
jgi:hypothetical protein